MILLEKSDAGVEVGNKQMIGLFSVYLLGFTKRDDGDALENNPTLFFSTSSFYSYFLSSTIYITAY